MPYSNFIRNINHAKKTSRKIGEPIFLPLMSGIKSLNEETIAKKIPMSEMPLKDDDYEYESLDEFGMIEWDYILRNPAAIYYIRLNIDRFNFGLIDGVRNDNRYELSKNPAAISLFESRPKLIDWEDEGIFWNDNAIDWKMFSNMNNANDETWNVKF